MRVSPPDFKMATGVNGPSFCAVIGSCCACGQRLSHETAAGKDQQSFHTFTYRNSVSTVIGGSCCLKASFVLNSSADEFGLLRQAGSTRL